MSVGRWVHDICESRRKWIVRIDAALRVESTEEHEIAHGYAGVRKCQVHLIDSCGGCTCRYRRNPIRDKASAADRNRSNNRILPVSGSVDDVIHRKWENEWLRRVRQQRVESRVSDGALIKARIVAALKLLERWHGLVLPFQSVDAGEDGFDARTELSVVRAQ